MDKSVIIECAKGDVKAFKKIFDFYLPKMRPVCLRYTRTDFEADDILQEAFVKIYYNIGQFKFEGSFEGWVRKIVVHTALNHFNKPTSKLLLQNIEDTDIEDITDEDISIIENSDLEILNSVINQLPHGYKMVFNLYVIEDYTHKEIAELLGISEGTSRSQYAKARKMIKMLLSRQRNNLNSALINRKIS